MRLMGLNQSWIAGFRRVNGIVLCDGSLGCFIGARKDGEFQVRCVSRCFSAGMPNNVLNGIGV